MVEVRQKQPQARSRDTGEIIYWHRCSSQTQHSSASLLSEQAEGRGYFTVHGEPASHISDPQPQLSKRCCALKLKKEKLFAILVLANRMIPPVHNLLHLPPVRKIRFFTFLNTRGSRKKSFNCVQVSETPPSICLSCLQQTWDPSLSSAFSTCSPKAPQIWVLHPCPGTTCTHQAAQPWRRRALLFPAPSQLPAGYLIKGSWSSSQALPQHQ